ncbi:hypothetical protein CRM79_11675 [Pantoea agglomerans]|nr:hypothetical protein [Pantoea agglomerans]PEI03834.1 hypothetical protein CRM79_11675 [Pantoea agglomerans]
MSFIEKIKNTISKNRLVFILALTLISVIASSGCSKAIKEIVGSAGVIVIISSIIFLPHRALEIFRFFIFQYEDRTLKKVAGTFTILSWLAFLLTYLMLPLGFLVLGRSLLLAFILFTILGSILTFYDLEKNGNLSVRKIRLGLWFMLPIFFIFTNALASSYFTQISALSISSVPYTEFTWKFVFSVMALSLLLQPISYLVFITQTDKTKGYQSATLLALLLSASFIMVAIPHWGTNILASVLDHATRFEWRDEAMCGKLKIKKSDQRYFGFHSDKYTVYLSNTHNWGFYELKCEKDHDNNDTFTMFAVDIETRRPWFKS